MARRKKSDDWALGLLLVIGVPIWAGYKFIESVGWVVPIAITIGSILLFVAYESHKKTKRMNYLNEKYGDPEIVKKIYDGVCWQGQTDGQLIDSIGEPVAIDEKILKTKKKEIWKYNKEGANRFGLRITLENDVVVGWDKRG